MKADKMIGFKCGRLRIVERAGSDKHRHSLYKCICDCGNTIVTHGYTLKQGRVKSCGCSRRKYQSAQKNNLQFFDLEDNS